MNIILVAVSLDLSLDYIIHISLPLRNSWTHVLVLKLLSLYFSLLHMTLSIQDNWVHQLAIHCFWLQAKVRGTSSYEINPNYKICKNYITDFLSDIVISHLQTFQDQHLCLIVSCCTETLTHLRTKVSLITLQSSIRGTYKVWKVFSFQLRSSVQHFTEERVLKLFQYTYTFLWILTYFRNHSYPPLDLI
jgi:hypothetical protein